MSHSPYYKAIALDTSKITPDFTSVTYLCWHVYGRYSVTWYCYTTVILLYKWIITISFLCSRIIFDTVLSWRTTIRWTTTRESSEVYWFGDIATVEYCQYSDRIIRAWVQVAYTLAQFAIHDTCGKFSTATFTCNNQIYFSINESAGKSPWDTNIMSWTFIWDCQWRICSGEQEIIKWFDGVQQRCVILLTWWAIEDGHIVWQGRAPTIDCPYGKLVHNVFSVEGVVVRCAIARYRKIPLLIHHVPVYYVVLHLWVFWCLQVKLITLKQPWQSELTQHYSGNW